MPLSLTILDQWAQAGIGSGPNKHWLHTGLERSFEVSILNADDGAWNRMHTFICAARAAAAEPGNLRARYHKEMEWASKRPGAYQRRTRRFQHVLASQTKPADAILQIGSLFGPLDANGAVQLSYQDQTISQAARHWPQWLPPGFSAYQEKIYAMEHATLSSKDAVLTYSEHTRQHMIAEYGLEPERVHVAYTACKMAFPEPETILGAPRKERLLFAHTDFVRKGGDIVFDAFESMRRSRPGLELIMVGGKATMPLPDGARHLGVVPQRTLQELCLSASLIVHPARHDAFPNVLKEAQVCGLPAVASDSIGIPEIVTHDRTGIIIKHPDAESLAHTTLSLLDDPQRLHAMRLACLEDRWRFLPETCVETIAAIIRNTVAARPRKQAS